MASILPSKTRRSGFLPSVRDPDPGWDRSGVPSVSRFSVIDRRMLLRVLIWPPSKSQLARSGSRPGFARRGGGGAAVPVRPPGLGPVLLLPDLRHALRGARWEGGDFGRTRSTRPEETREEAILLQMPGNGFNHGFVSWCEMVFVRPHYLGST